MNILTFFLVVLSCVAFSHQQGDFAAHIQKVRESFQSCIKDTGVNAELPIKAVKEGEFPDDKNLKCFFKCMFEKMGHMDSSGKITFSDLDKIPANLDKAQITAAATKCQDTKGTDACDTAFQVAKCFRTAIAPLIHEGSLKAV